ncbi:DNA-binding domain-containing protein [Agarivorans sp. Alg241-V36]|uniref:HvfC/BufC N-terminal domain-containing protein n=1 Tax=Agarivorans sp. Alg241-V36 TaxID=2305992 RepID=UPI0013D3F96A|nr:DNA-binding domain-containing protein [Agarivorans sp. Alg241-V36]
MLKQLQQEFSDSLNQTNTSVEARLANNALSPDESMQIYQNNYLLSLSEALSATYPTVQKLVGEDYFKFVAKSFILQHGHNQGDLNLFGHGFNQFLQQQDALAQLPYLADIAQLDWLIEQTAGQALPSQYFTVEALQSIPVEQLGDVVLHLAPHQSLLASQYPVFAIYQMVQQDQVEAIELDEQDFVLFSKQPNFEVQLEQISTVSYEFLSHCQQQRPLGELPQHCLAELEPLLGESIQQQRLSHFSFASERGESHDATL